MKDDPEPMVGSGTVDDRAERLTRTIRDQSSPNLRPRDSATLILIDRSGPVPKVLLGRRHERHRFLPGKFVFPGGRVEIQGPADADGRAAARARRRAPDAAREAAEPRQSGGLRARRHPRDLRRNRLDARRAVAQRFPGAGRGLGAFCQGRHRPRPQRRAFHRPRHHAAGPPAPVRQPLLCRRFQCRRRASDEGFVGADAELVEVVWMPIAEARRLDIPGITAIVLEELQDRIATGMSHDHPVPIYRMLHKKFLRELL